LSNIVSSYAAANPGASTGLRSRNEERWINKNNRISCP
jgi:hypothetical protein